MPGNSAKASEPTLFPYTSLPGPDETQFDQEVCKKVKLSKSKYSDCRINLKLRKTWKLSPIFNITQTLQIE
jgi:hypothetical protein